MFLIDKYTPKNLDEFIFHKDKINLLKEMSKDDSIPHMIFCGPNGSGKRTIINCFMEMIYDKEVHKISHLIYKIPGSANNITEVSIKQSNYHIIIEPNNNNFDKYLIQEVVKEYAKKISLQVFTSNKTFKTVLINNIDNLSYYAQTSLRRTMEIYSGTCRFIMICNSLSRVINPIRSRCYNFKVNSPTNDELFELLLDVSHKEKIPIGPSDYNQIITIADGNVKKALWMLQYKQFEQNNKMELDYKISYDYALDDIISKLLSKNTQVCIEIRNIIYNIMITNIDGTTIIKDIINRLMENDQISEQQKIKIVEKGCHYEHNLIKGRHEIMHLDPFISGILFILMKTE